jgi:hypothetical protein
LSYPHAPLILKQKTYQELFCFVEADSISIR